MTAAVIGWAIGLPLPRTSQALVAPSFKSIVNPFGLSTLPLVHLSTPVEVDLDGDGDLDVLAGDGNGDLFYFQNIGTPTAPVFAEPVVEPFGLQSLDFFASAAAADIDGDGDLDLLIGDTNGDTYFFRNTGTPTAPAFAAPVKNAFGLTNVNSQAAPEFVDIDGDGDLDVFIGSSDATLSYFQNIGTSTAPSFAAPVTSPFGVRVASELVMPRFADLDGDGDADLFVGDETGTISYYENSGTATAPAFGLGVENPFGLKAGAAGAAPAIGDLDGDGDLDFLVGGEGAALLYFRNVGAAGAPAFDATSVDPFGLQPGSHALRGVFVDLDGDGDLDLAVGDTHGDTLYYQNVGSASAPSYAPPVSNPFGLTAVEGLATPAFADLDGDGDLDALIGAQDGSLSYFENVGTATAPSFATSVQNPFGLSAASTLASPTFADIDGDGLLDVFVGVGNGNTRYFHNIGIATRPQFATAVANPFGLSGTRGFASPRFADLDRDGDLDAFIVDRDGVVNSFENLGTRTTAEFARPVKNPFGLVGFAQISAVAFGDVDGDGDLDALIAGDPGNFVLYTAVGSTLCADAPLDTCAAFAGGSFLVNETKPGKEQLSAQLKAGPALSQTDFGDPEHKADGYALCLYDDTGRLAGRLSVDRGAEMCGAHRCWKNVGGAAPAGKGYAYKDAVASSDGVTQLALHAGAAGKSTVMLKAKNNAAKGQTALSTRIADALFSSGTVTMQLQKSAGNSCLAATLSDSQRYPGYLKAK